TGAGDHHRRRQRRGDRRELLLAEGEVGAHQPLQLFGRVDPDRSPVLSGGGHDSTLPEDQTGQIDWKSQRSQCCPGRATSSSLRTTRVAAISCSSTSLGASTSGGGSWAWTLGRLS